MKFFEKYFIPLLITFGLMIIIPYMIIQTSFGSFIASYWLSSHYGHTITIQNIKYSPFDLFTVVLNGVKIEDKSKDPRLDVKKVVLKINPATPFNFKQLKEIRIENGHMTIDKMDSDLTISADQLQLVNIDTLVHSNNQYYVTHGVTGGASPWTLDASYNLFTDTQFKFTAQEFNTPLGTFNSLYATGEIKNGLFYINTMGAGLNSAQISITARQQTDKSWIVDQLQLSQLRYQTPQEIDTSNLVNVLNTFPKFTVVNAEITNSSIDSKNLKIDRFDAYAENITVDNGLISTSVNQSELGFHALDLLYDNTHLNQPTLRLLLNKETPENIEIDYASTYWNEGIVQLRGILNKKQLWLDNLLLARINYTFPENGITAISLLPSYFDAINIQQLTVTPSQFTDIQEYFPSQYTNVEIYGKNIALNRQVESYLANGEFIINIPHATINTITMRHLNLSMDVTPTAFNIKQASAFVDNRVIEAHATILQVPPKTITATLAGYGLTEDILQKWHVNNATLTNSPIVINGMLNSNGQFYLQAQTNIINKLPSDE